MASAEDVRLVDSIPARLKRVEELNAKQAGMEKEEEARREQWMVSFHAARFEVAAAQAELERAGNASVRILSEVPQALKQAESQAGSALRACEEPLKRARQDVEIAQRILSVRRDEEKKGYVLQKHDLEALSEQITKAIAAQKAEAAKRADLEVAYEKAMSAVEAEVTKIRSAALQAVATPATMPKGKKATVAT